MKASRWLFLLAALVLGAWYLFGDSKPPLPKEVANEDEVSSAKIPAPEPDGSGKPVTPVASPRAHTSPNTSGRPASTAAPTGLAAPERPLQDEILRDEKGALLRTDQTSAAKACAARGMRLPSLRELARLATSRGAAGFKDAGELRDQDLIESYTLHTPTNADGKRDDFYYSAKGYKEPVRTAAGQIFWSSSVCVGCVQGDEGGDSAYSFYSETGEFHDHYGTLPFAVRCLKP